jgi:hypothetical protein
VRFPFLDGNFADPLLRYNGDLNELKAKLPADQYLELTLINLASMKYEFTDNFLRDFN